MPTLSKKNNNSKTSNSIRRVFFTILVILFSASILAGLNTSSKLEEVALSDVIARANDEHGDIKKITVSGQKLEITLKDKDQPTQVSRKDALGTLYEQGLINHCAKLSGKKLQDCRSAYPLIEYVEPIDIMGDILNNYEIGRASCRERV